jgi:hypothetical protein
MVMNTGEYVNGTTFHGWHGELVQMQIRYDREKKRAWDFV